jgi:hypothetical protein
VKVQQWARKSKELVHSWWTVLHVEDPQTQGRVVLNETKRNDGYDGGVAAALVEHSWPMMGVLAAVVVAWMEFESGEVWWP